MGRASLESLARAFGRRGSRRGARRRRGGGDRSEPFVFVFGRRYRRGFRGRSRDRCARCRDRCRPPSNRARDDAPDPGGLGGDPRRDPAPADGGGGGGAPERACAPTPSARRRSRRDDRPCHTVSRIETCGLRPRGARSQRPGSRLCDRDARRWPLRSRRRAGLKLRGGDARSRVFARSEPGRVARRRGASARRRRHPARSTWARTLTLGAEGAGDAAVAAGGRPRQGFPGDGVRGERRSRRRPSLRRRGRTRTRSVGRRIVFYEPGFVFRACRVERHRVVVSLAVAGVPLDHTGSTRARGKVFRQTSAVPGSIPASTPARRVRS